MSAPLPTFSDGELAFAESPPRRCYWCNWPVQAWHPAPEARNGVDMRYCVSAQTVSGGWRCANVADDLAAVVLDRVAEWDGAPEFVDRVPVCAGYETDGEEVVHILERHGGRLSSAFASCYHMRPPSPSQRMALALMHDDVCAWRLRDVREKHGIKPCPIDWCEQPGGHLGPHSRGEIRDMLDRRVWPQSVIPLGWTGQRPEPPALITSGPHDDVPVLFPHADMFRDRRRGVLPP